MKEISDKDNYPILDGIPMNLQYEQVYLSPHPSFTDESEGPDGKKLKSAVKRRLREIESNKFSQALLNPDVDVFLTTNYDHTLYRGKGYKVIVKNASEKLYSVRRWKKVSVGGK